MDIYTSKLLSLPLWFPLPDFIGPSCLQPMFAMIISVMLFPFLNLLRAIKEAALRLIKGEITLPNDDSDVVELELQERPLCDQKHYSNEGSDSNLEPNTYLIENAKIVIRLLPIWTMLSMFAVIFQQPATFFMKQGMTMDRSISRNFKIPPATLQSAITLVLIPITKMVTRNEKGITLMQRMGVGMFLSIIAMMIAAVVETKRLEISRTMDNRESETVPLSIL
ncbi:hypothetical protein GQ457_07G002060 [Hibiscus cannabinus]